jgi:hypothetical protein
MELAQYEIDQDIAAEDHPGFDSLIEQLAILRDHQVNITVFMGEGAIFPPALALTGPINLVGMLLRAADPVTGVVDPADLDSSE